eukprot:TRINITY_DN7512_c0_g1_i1.p1 TRINITY_DN7512_c0_g1~~TRINITY_DN7512_c0_g1_i1.p1  ORF type:complete len:444 (+),score=105.04 TRINITY_DN7512_c0_g1_i1:1334-2665(+)
MLTGRRMGMTLYVKVAATGHIEPVEVEWDWSVYDVKQYIEGIVGCKAKDQMLLCDGQEMEGQLCQSGVGSETEVVLVTHAFDISLYGGAETFVAVHNNNLVSWGKHNIKLYNVKYPVLSQHSLIVVKTNLHVLITEGDHEVQLHDASEVVRTFNLQTGALLVKSDGSLLLWPTTPSLLPFTTITKPIVDVAVTHGSCTTAAALLSDGTVFTCGNPLFGGDSSSVQEALRGIKKVVGFGSGFAAITAASRVVVWGMGCALDQQLRAVLTDVVDLTTTYGAVAARHACGKVTVWGSPDYGGRPDPGAAAFLSSSIVKVYSSHAAFCALKEGGLVAAWGRTDKGGTIPQFLAPVIQGVVNVVSTYGAFAVLMGDGQVACWGSKHFGGEPGVECRTSLTRGVASIAANNKAFAAVKRTGEVLAWGNPAHGGNCRAAQDAFAQLLDIS